MIKIIAGSIACIMLAIMCQLKRKSLREKGNLLPERHRIRYYWAIADRVRQLDVLTVVLVMLAAIVPTVYLIVVEVM